MGIVGYFITTRILIPDMKPDELAAYNGWMADLEKHVEELKHAADAGRILDPLQTLRSLMDKASSAPEGAIALMSFSSSCMTIFYWVGFTAMEVGTGGASHYPIVFTHDHSLARNTEEYGVVELLLDAGGYTAAFLPVGGGLKDKHVGSCRPAKQKAPQKPATATTPTPQPPATP